MKPRQLDRCDRRMVRERLIKAPKVQEDGDADVARVSSLSTAAILGGFMEPLLVTGRQTGETEDAVKPKVSKLISSEFNLSIN